MSSLPACKKKYFQSAKGLTYRYNTIQWVPNPGQPGQLEMILYRPFFPVAQVQQEAVPIPPTDIPFLPPYDQNNAMNVIDIGALVNTFKGMAYGNALMYPYGAGGYVNYLPVSKYEPADYSYYYAKIVGPNDADFDTTSYRMGQNLSSLITSLSEVQKYWAYHAADASVDMADLLNFSDLIFSSTDKNLFLPPGKYQVDAGTPFGGTVGKILSNYFGTYLGYYPTYFGLELVQYQ